MKILKSKKTYYSTNKSKLNKASRLWFEEITQPLFHYFLSILETIAFTCYTDAKNLIFQNIIQEKPKNDSLTNAILFLSNYGTESNV